MPTAAREPNWYERAACRAEGWAPYFDDPQPSHAQGTCSSCPVRHACLSFALDNGIEDGIWGGLKPVARRRLTWRRNAA